MTIGAGVTGHPPAPALLSSAEGEAMSDDKLAAIEHAANAILDRPYADPDDDAAVCARAALRLRAERAARERVEGALRDIADMSPNWMKPDAILESERWMRDRARAALAAQEGERP